MRKMMAGALVSVAIAWLLVNAFIATAFLPPIGWVEIHDRELVRALQDVEPWIRWTGLVLFAGIMSVFVTAARRAPLALRLPGWAISALVVFLAAVAAFVVSGIWTIDPRAHFEIGRAGDEWFHRMTWLNSISYYLGISTLAVLIAGALLARPSKGDQELQS